MTIQRHYRPIFKTYAAIAPIARLKPGVTAEQAKPIVATQGEQIKAASRFKQRVQYVLFAAGDVRMPFDPEASVVPARLLAALTIVVAVVLLIAAVNIAGLLMARGVGRAGELALRRVVGAGAWRIARQLLVESVVLSAGGGALGILVGYWLLALFHAYTPNRFAVDIEMDAPVIAVAAAVCLGVGLLIGVSPALGAAGMHVPGSLPSAGSPGSRTTRSRFRYVVVAPQICLAFALLMMAAIHVSALTAMELAHPGYDRRHAIVTNFGLASDPLDNQAAVEKFAERTRLFYRQLMARLAAIPATGGIAVVSGLRFVPRRRPMPSTGGLCRRQVGGCASSGRHSRLFRDDGNAARTGPGFRRARLPATPHVDRERGGARRLWPGATQSDDCGRQQQFPMQGEKSIGWRCGVVSGSIGAPRPGAIAIDVLPLGRQWRVTATTIVARVNGVHGSREPDQGRGCGRRSLASVCRTQTIGTAGGGDSVSAPDGGSNSRSVGPDLGCCWPAWHMASSHIFAQRVDRRQLSSARRDRTSPGWCSARGSRSCWRESPPERWAHSRPSE